MKKIILSLSLLLAAVPQLRAEPFTYQGKLENAGSPYTGTVTVTLGLFTTATGGVATRTQSFPGTTVTNGVFSVTATNFVASNFNGDARYLEISVNDGVTSTTLAPRQEVTWAAMAMHAKKAETVTGSVPAGQITGTLNPSILSGTGVTNANVTFGNGGAAFSSLAGTAPFSVSNSTKVTNLNSDLLDGIDSAAFLQKSGGAMTGPLGIANATALSFGNQARQMINLYNADYGIGIQSGTQYYRTAGQFAWFHGGAHNDAAYNAGAGGTTLMTLSSNGTLTARGPDSGFNVINRNDSTQEWALYSRDSGETGQFAIWNNGTGDVAAFSPNGDLYLVGEVSTTVMTIRGGADVAEPFEMTKPEEMEPGTVVVIDEENAGQLKKSSASYDNKVAGIISGAGGVKPGLRLHQEGVMEGDHHVALTGRVYVKADAAFGKIKPGDLLTTSSTPGHAMKVKDHEKAQGAILGKAMSALDKDTGLVLVLVTLQ